MTLVIIPARMGSTRLPGKPLEFIGEKTIIEHCIHRAQQAGFEPIVATDSLQIKTHLMCGWRPLATVVMTGECASGTDRVAAAAEIIDPEGKHEFVINYQGDMPFLDPEWLDEFARNRERDDRDVTTAYCEVELVEVCRPHFRRVKTDSHIGLYGYKREALRFFARLNQSHNEIFDRLEQSRNPTSFTWGYYQFPSMPIEINTQADLDRARSCLT